MYLLFLVAIFLSRNSVNGQFSSNECTPHTPINVTLPEIDGIWYIAAYVNETNVEEQMNCIVMSYAYNETTEMTHEVRSAIHYGKTEPETNSADYGMASPGVIDVTYPPDNHIIELFLEYTENESFIISVCQRINGTKTIDRVAVLVRERRLISRHLIYKKLLSIGIYKSPNNPLFWPRQRDCPN